VERSAARTLARASGEVARGTVAWCCRSIRWPTGFLFLQSKHKLGDTAGYIVNMPILTFPWKFSLFILCEVVN